MFGDNITVSGTATVVKFERRNRYAIAQLNDDSLTVLFFEDFFRVDSIEVADKAEAGIWMTGWCNRDI
jgi:hypothetical protein